MPRGRPKKNTTKPIITVAKKITSLTLDDGSSAESEVESPALCVKCGDETVKKLKGHDIPPLCESCLPDAVANGGEDTVSEDDDEDDDEEEEEEEEEEGEVVLETTTPLASTVDVPDPFTPVKGM